MSKRFMKLVCVLLSLIMLLGTVPMSVFAEMIPDESGVYLIGTAEELFAFAEIAKTTAEADKAAGNTRTALSAKLTANINLNPGATFAYDHETGLVTVAKGDKSCKMGSGMKETELGNFHPVYNGLCTWEQWNDETLTTEQLNEFRNNLIERMNEKVEALGLRKWTPIGTKTLPYIGYFDGNGHTIDGLYINDNTVYYTGLFGVIGNFSTISGTLDYGEVKNITIGENSLIVGYKADTAGATGAIVGMTQFDKITGCTNYATVVGKGSGRLNLSNSGLVGGIVGYANNDVKNCTNHGTVVSRESAGGIVGNIMGNPSQQGNILYCANYGSVYAEAHADTGYAGGIAINSGVGNGTAAGCGGTVESCVNYGYVEGYYAGGVIYRGSQNTQVQYCANFGKVAGATFVSGVVTYMANGGFTMEGCFNAGAVTALPYEGDGTVTSRVFALVSSVDESEPHTVKNCYNDETVFPSGGAVFRDGVNATNSGGVTTEFFATGEAAYKMGSYNARGWRQNIATPAEEGKIPETYPTINGTRRVYEDTHYCCHTDDTNKQAHKTVFYSNVYGNITDEHTPDESGICAHCGADVRKPIFSVDTLPDAKVGAEYTVTIRLSDSAPMADGNIRATVSETDDTEYTFSHGLTGNANYTFYDKYFYTISGTPTEAGTLTFTLSATNENGTTKKTYTIKITEGDPLEVTSDAKLPHATVGEYYSSGYLMATTSFSKTWTLKEGSVLPDGLTLEKGTYGYQITGTPTTAGDYTFTLVVTAGGQTAEKTFTLRIFGEGGCRHSGMVKIPGTPATCKKDGIADYYHCNICGIDFSDAAGTTELYNKDDLKIAANHIDQNGDGKCDFCGRGIVFRKVTADSDIVYGGTYILVAKIGDKYYALTIPPEGKSGREYEKLMILGEITANEKGEFTLKTLEDNGVMMLTTGFCAPSGGELDIVPRYGFSAVCGGVRYGLADYGNMNFYVESGGPAKYGYRIAFNGSGAALIGSVEQEWWSKPETAENGLLRAFDMVQGGASTKFMSFYAASYYNGEKGEYSGATMTDCPIYLYRMTVEAQTSSGVTFITNDNNSNTGKGGFTELPDAIDLSNVNGVADAVEQTYVESLIESTGTTKTEVIAGVCADIKAVGFEADASLRYSVTPKVTITDRSGNTLYEGELPDEKLNGDPITVTLYTGGIYPAQIIHYKNDGTKEYFYSKWSSEATAGAKTFEYDNGYVTFTVDSCSEIEILKTAVPETPTVVSGDVNGDGKIDTVDLTILRAYLVDNSIELSAGADLNGDGKIDTADLTILRQKLVGITAGE